MTQPDQPTQEDREVDKKAIHNSIGDFFWNEPDFDDVTFGRTMRRVQVPAQVVRKICDAAIAVHLERHRLTAQAAREEELRELREAAQAILDGRFATYRAKNGRDVSIEADDGERCWIVHSDDIFSLEMALQKLTKPKEAGDGE